MPRQTLIGEISDEEYRNGPFRVLSHNPDSVPLGGAWTTVDGLDCVHEDHFAEHVTRACVVMPEGRAVLCSRSGVLWWGYDMHESVTDDETAMQLARSVSDTTTGGFDCTSYDLPDGYESVASGWHSSMEPSDQSDMINALAGGEYPPEWTDYHSPTTTLFPYAVVFEDTRNVCSQPISIYAHRDVTDQFKALLTDTRAAPANAGVR